jgi:hypothetical protein
MLSASCGADNIDESNYLGKLSSLVGSPSPLSKIETKGWIVVFDQYSNKGPQIFCLSQSAKIGLFST